eukprot:3586246-Pyramimonas_sp.AAC.1
MLCHTFRAPPSPPRTILLPEQPSYSSLLLPPPAFVCHLFRLVEAHGGGRGREARRAFAILAKR